MKILSLIGFFFLLINIFFINILIYKKLKFFLKKWKKGLIFDFKYTII